MDKIQESSNKKAEQRSYIKQTGSENKIIHATKPYTAKADWVVLKSGETPIAEVFYTAYLAKNSAKQSNANRPITFVFNGGPGASSAYLQLGALGPERVEFGQSGEILPSPAKLVSNKESWLTFTDLVFIDPVGTGLSRVIEDKSIEQDKKEQHTSQFFQFSKDIDSIAESISRLLSEFKRWESPVCIAGESYGGFRVAKLTRLLQERFGVGLKAAFLISPALEISSLEYSDYNVTPWLDVFPSLVVSAAQHQNSKDINKKLNALLENAEKFAHSKLAVALLKGSELPQSERASLLNQMSELTQISKEKLSDLALRLSASVFVRELIREKQLVCGLYDASLTTYDPFPAREKFEGPDTTLSSIDRVFNSGINTLLRSRFQLNSDRMYSLLSYEVFNQWKIDSAKYTDLKEIGSTDDLRYGLSLNQDMKVYILHGYFDLVTPYFASKRIVSQMQLPESAKSRVFLKSFLGGHMFYSWESSRKELFQLAKRAFEF